MSTISVYEEFIGDNLDKRYPLTDDSTWDLPDSFLADISIFISTIDRAGEDSYKYNLYISRVTVYPDYVYVEFSDYITSNVIAKTDPIPLTLTMEDTTESRTIMIRPVGPIPVNGFIVIGTCSDISKYPGTHGIAYEAGQLFPSTVSIATGVVNGINIDGQIVTGDIVLEAGDNVDITYDEGSNTIHIDAKAPEGLITTDEDLIEHIINTYGQPIITINGISPDSSGNFSIQSTDCMIMEQDPANSIITFYNPCAPSCASYEFLDEALTRIKDLNASVSLLKSFYDSVSNTLAQMGARVSAVIESKTNNS